MKNLLLVKKGISSAAPTQRSDNVCNTISYMWPKADRGIVASLEIILIFLLVTSQKSLLLAWAQFRCSSSDAIGPFMLTSLSIAYVTRRFYCVLNVCLGYILLSKFIFQF